MIAAGKPCISILEVRTSNTLERERKRGREDG
ncbi:hypothetical protein AGR4B_Lc10375 [Agrobacterium tumefaciens str. CFBP 5621]|nr:hypothetical protein AGR4B_Lc10375 [Agrobacterium tumefaciens str. CFBP 5621]